MKKHQPISSAVIAPCLIMCSDEDLPVVQYLTAGLTTKGGLVIAIDQDDSTDERYNCSTWVEMDYPETRRLARRLGVTLVKLPACISDCMAEWREIRDPWRDDVQACFKEVTECLLAEGCHFRIRRTTGPRGYICC